MSHLGKVALYWSFNPKVDEQFAIPPAKGRQTRVAEGIYHTRLLTNREPSNVDITQHQQYEANIGSQ
jgi:hypothetical protein